MSTIQIIHVTDSFTKLKSILNSTSFRLSYSEENFKVGNYYVSHAAHPMVCFMEQDLSELPIRKISYGQYGVGFSKDWARKKQLSPVIYLTNDSLAALGLGKLLRARKVRDTIPKELRLPIMQIKCFTKNEKGYNSALKDKEFEFKMENEWRYVPSKKLIGNNLISMDKSKYKKNRKKFNDKLLNYSLKFYISEIATVYVRDEQETEILVNDLRIPMDMIRVSPW